tara:strand:+ start:1016 stop:1366 length:351 start_codon:yes stop_codon:yes gene_type:complete
MLNPNELQKYMLIKRDARELRQILFGINDINDWNKLIILYTIFLMYQHFYLIYKFINKLNRPGPFNFQRDFKDVYIFFFFICNVRVIFLYMIKGICKVDKKLALSIHSNLKEYFDY